MPEDKDIILQFTQEDRDMLRDVSHGVRTLLEKHDEQRKRLNTHSKRIKTLENLAIEVKASGRTLKWTWGAIAAIAGLFGLHIAQGH